MKKSYKYCEFCQKRIKSKYQHYKEKPGCKLANKNKIKEDEELLNNWSIEKTIECKICGHKAKELTRHLKTEHQMTVSKYREKHGEVISEYERLKKSIFWRKKNAGKNNPMYNKKPWNTDKTRSKEIVEKLGSVWRGKNFSREHKNKLAIAKTGITGEAANAYGPHNISEEGLRKMREGSYKALVRFRKSKQSKFEDELYLYLKEIKPNITRQERIGYNIVDFYDKESNTVIEADGIYWHAILHGIVTEEDANHQQKHTYRYDRSKTTYLLNRNYKLIRIREDDFHTHKKKGDAKRWLKGLLK
jgi:very-short-patch-repair endonuclease